MAHVINIRKTVGNEKGDVLIDFDVFSKEKISRRKIFATSSPDNQIIEVVGGCKSGLDLFPVNTRVMMQEICDAHYSHRLIEMA